MTTVMLITIIAMVMIMENDILKIIKMSARTKTMNMRIEAIILTITVKIMLLIMIIIFLSLLSALKKCMDTNSIQCHP